MVSLDATLAVSVEDDVVFEFTVVNTGTESVDLQFSSGKTADVAVYDAETSETVWQWSADKMFTQVVESQTLESTQMLEGVYTWENPTPGEYVAVATLASDVTAEDRVEFSVC